MAALFPGDVDGQDNSQASVTRLPKACRQACSWPDAPPNAPGAPQVQRNRAVISLDGLTQK